MARQSVVLSVLTLASLLAFEAVAQNAAPAARVGIVLPKAQLGQGNTGQDVGEPVRQLIMSYMAGPVLELVPIQARIPAQIEAEAAAQKCTHLLYTSVEQKKAGKGMGKLFGMLAPAAGMMGGLGNASGAMVAGAASQIAATAAMQSAHQDAMASLTQAQAGSVRARDEISLTYQFVTVGGTKSPISDTLRVKARNDGENLLGPLAEQVASIAISAAIQP